MDKYSFPSTQNTVQIPVYFSLWTAFYTQRNYKDNSRQLQLVFEIKHKITRPEKGNVKSKK
jgi:hypothetical protein